MSAKRKGAAPLTPDLLARKGEAVSAARETGCLDEDKGHFPEIGSDIREGGPTSGTLSSDKPSGISRRWLIATIVVLVVGAGAAGYFARSEINPVTELARVPQPRSSTAIPSEPSNPIAARGSTVAAQKSVSSETGGGNAPAIEGAQADLATASGPSVMEGKEIAARDRPEARSEAVAVPAQADAQRSPVPVAIPSVPPPVRSAPAMPAVSAEREAVSRLPALPDSGAAPAPPADLAAKSGSVETVSPAAAGASVATARPVHETPKPADSPVVSTKPSDEMKTTSAPEKVARATSLPRPPKRPEAPVAAKPLPYLVQLASVKSQAAAAREWTRLNERHAALFAPLQASVQKADVRKRGIFYRLRADGFASYRQANALCGKLKAAGQGCLVVRR